MGSDVTRAGVIAVARQWIGTPYHHQASRRGVGCDCLGLVRGVWRDVYGCDPERPPNYTRDWAEAGAAETLLEAAERHLEARDRSSLLAGRVAVFRFRKGAPAKHLGIVTVDGRMVHAMEGLAVAEVVIVPWWQRRIAGVFDFPGLVG
ncbi:MAG TPA: NlpC/P60 family protein [Hyphomicrobiaceae bacterium]|nr:NlpC/P60 family protein [Hyphomicrobiaceae bacterium]